MWPNAGDVRPMTWNLGSPPAQSAPRLPLPRTPELEKDLLATPPARIGVLLERRAGRSRCIVQLRALGTHLPTKSRSTRGLLDSARPEDASREAHVLLREPLRHLPTAPPTRAHPRRRPPRPGAPLPGAPCAAAPVLICSTASSHVVLIIDCPSSRASMHRYRRQSSSCRVGFE